MRSAERKLEMRGKKKGGSKWEKLREWEKKRNCPFDAKKVCPVTYTINSRLVSTKLKRIESQSVSICGKTNGIT